MCGISMILDFDGKARTEHLQQMMQAIKHRGPDASQHMEKPFGKGIVFLGSNRLQIIDKDNNSNQPFLSQDGRYALIFNGEIYNYENLRNELLTSGVQFKTRSDTEVLLYWLIKRGKDGIQQLNGMFAFVFINFESCEILIARDPFGIKPLFIHQTTNHLIVSSEIQGILSTGLVDKQLNEDAIPHYLAYKYAPRPRTFFKDIEEVMSGTIWEIDKNGKSEKSLLPEQTQEERRDIKQLLIDSVVQQYAKNNNTGIMLSGGVDSTLLLAILNKELGYRNIPVFSVASKGKNRFDTKDGSFAVKAAKLYQAEYNEIGMDENSLEDIDNYIETLSQPIADSGGYLTWLIAQKAVGKSMVLLSGAGADELFGGYNRHKAFYNYLKYRDKPWFPLLKQGGKLSGFSNKMNQLKKLASSIEDDPSTTFNNFIQSDSFRITNKLWENHLPNDEHFRKALNHDKQNYLGADVLAITDHASMQHSIETRVPYLDSQLVRAARDIRDNQLLKNGSKWMFKEQLSNYGGKAFAMRKKQGLGLPMNSWLKEEKHWFFNSKEQLIHEFIPQKKITELRKLHVKGKENLTQELWRILLLHKWLSLNF